MNYVLGPNWLTLSVGGRVYRVPRGDARFATLTEFARNGQDCEAELRLRPELLQAVELLGAVCRTCGGDMVDDKCVSCDAS